MDEVKESVASMTSRLPGFYKRPIAERLQLVADMAGLTTEESEVFSVSSGLSSGEADRMVENAIGIFPLPLGIAANFRLNGQDCLVPMAVEEPSVLAASSNAANLLRDGEGIRTSSTEPIMIGQIQVLDFPDLDAARAAIESQAEALVAASNRINPRLVERGGGAKRLLVREFPDTALGPMLVLHLEVDVRDAMGANIINTMVESLAPEVERITGGRVRLRILSNLADKRLARAEGRVKIARLARAGWTGEEVAQGIVEASVMADVDPYRAATHNKGAMNGVDAFLVAAGQDWRAIEAGCHAYAARDGRYRSLSRWRIDGEDLVGVIELPMQVGVVGGVTKTHAVVKVVHKILGFPNATRLGEIAAAAGLAQNLAAIMALATEGIQRGHMSMHCRNVVAESGAVGDEVELVVAELRRRQTYDHATASVVLAEVRAGCHQKVA